jgi:hypothetical protein
MTVSRHELETVWKWGGYPGRCPGSLRAAREVFDGPEAIRWAVERPAAPSRAVESGWPECLRPWSRGDGVSPREHSARVAACPSNGPPTAWREIRMAALSQSP